MAMQNTLGLPELLENIISHLPERDILCNAQRVSQHWKNIIDNSPTIQKKMYFAPAEQPALSPVDYDEDQVKIFGGTPIYSRTTLINPLLKGDERSNTAQTHFQISRDFAVRTKPMKLFGRPTSHVHFRPNLMMAPPRIYWQINAQNKDTPSPLPSWRAMYLSQPPVAIVMLMIAYHHPAPPESRNMFKVMIRDNDGINLGLVYDTLAATIPTYDEILGSSSDFDPVVAHICWYETEIDDGEDEDSEDKGSGEDGSEGKDSEEDSSGDRGSGDENSGDEDGGDQGSVIYDSDGNVMDDSGSSMEDSGSEIHEYAEHESELGSDTGYQAADGEEHAESNQQTAE